MDSDTSEEQFYQFAADFFGRERDSIKERTRFKRDLKADSLDFLGFVLAVEDAFCCQISDDDLSLIKTVGDFWRFFADALGFPRQVIVDAPMVEQNGNWVEMNETRR